MVLAGGAGRRIGGAKALVDLAGRPLICYPVETMRRALGAVVVVSKDDSGLPRLPNTEIWIEPRTPRHPLVGILHALELAAGRPVLVCAADMPFVSEEAVCAIAETDPEGAPAVIASGQGALQPLLGCYEPSARELLACALSRPGARLTEVVAGIGPRAYEIEDPAVLFNVNTPDDLVVAAGMLERRRTPSTANRR